MEGQMQLRIAGECRSAIVLFVIAVLVPASSQSFNYKDALSKSILYFESQRSGWLPPKQRATWRHHSGLTDGLEHGVDLVGGYYDAGDNIKFGLPMAFTVTMLSWGVIQYGKQIAAAGEYHHALEAIKWGTDYFIKAHTHPDELWVHVGDAGAEHECWQRPEDMTSSRQAYKIDKGHPGSDVAAETAAAMAAASIVFRGTNSYYSHLLLYHAQHLFEFGDKFRGKYDDSIEAIKEFYPSKSGYKDELLWAALWLYRATGKSEYLNYAMDNAVAFGGATWAIHEFSWDIKYAGVQVLASMLAREEKHDSATDEIFRQYRSKAEHYMCACLNKTDTVNVKRTPGGLLYVRKWNNMQYVSTAIFLLTVYADHLKSTRQELTCSDGGSVSPDEISRFAKSQVDYILGSNPMNTSYLVGFGPKYSKRVHHRGASTISYKKSMSFIPCMKGFFWYARKEPNPNILFGALVGGPDDHDGFDDRRSNYRQTEACTYNTAPLVGVFAKLNEDESLSSISLLFIFSIVLFLVLLSLHVMREKIKSRMKSFLHSN